LARARLVGVRVFDAVDRDSAFLPPVSPAAVADLSSVLLAVLPSVFASPLASTFASVLPSFVLSAAGASLAAGSLSPARFRCCSLSALKSVSYQPPPFSRNTGADTRRRSMFLPQAGHFRSGRSVIFWSSSWCAPQAAHWYS
jgi:hypothetical protein